MANFVNFLFPGCSLPDCSNVNHEELEKETRPRCYSPISKRRKRMRHPTSLLEPVSPSQSSPHKVWSEYLLRDIFIFLDRSSLYYILCFFEYENLHIMYLISGE